MSNKPLVKHLLQLANAAFEQRIISRRGVVGRIVCFDLVMDFRYVLPCLVFCHRKCKSMVPLLSLLVLLFLQR